MTSEADDRLTVGEIEVELRNMSDADIYRAKSYARMIVTTASYGTEEDILQEAMLKLMSGDRIWRRGFGAVPALASVIRSMVNNAYKKEKNGPIDSQVLVRTLDNTEDSDTLIRQIDAITSSSPEDEVANRQSLERIEALVADDDELGLLVMTWAEGLRGVEAAADLGMDFKQYEAARKRLNRKLAPMLAERKEA